MEISSVDAHSALVPAVLACPQLVSCISHLCKVRLILKHWQCCPPCTICSTSETSLYTTNSRLISFLLFMHNKSLYRYVCCNTITSNLKALLPTTENRRETEGAGNKPTGGQTARHTESSYPSPMPLLAFSLVNGKSEELCAFRSIISTRSITRKPVSSFTQPPVAAAQSS